MALSANSLAVWRFVHRYIGERGYPPTLRELSEGCYLGKTVVVRHLAKLEAAGVLETTERVARGIRLLLEPPPQQ